MELLVLIAFIIFVIWLPIRILHKAGYSGWWWLILLVPVVNIILVWIFACADWPIMKNKSHQQ